MIKFVNMFQLTQEQTREVGGKLTTVRIYKNDQTGTELTTYLLYTDQQQNKWWTFEDLFQLPFIRQLAAKKVMDLYGYGLSLDDIKQITSEAKMLLRSKDEERYEKVYAKLLELEQLSNTMADPIKQCIGLCTIYLLLNDERPDTYLQATTNVKMSILALDITAQAFFLNWWTGIMRRSGQILKGFSQIVSAQIV